jgi:hypothetical protein
VNVLIATHSVSRTFDVGESTKDRGLQNYSLQGQARLRIREGYDGPSFDDDSGPTFEEKYHAADARIATSVSFVPESFWSAKIDDFMSMTSPRESTTHQRDHEAMGKAVAYAWYVPTDEDMVRRYGAPKYDELECYLKVGVDMAAELQAWLDCAASEPKLLPTIDLDGLYFHCDDPVIHKMPGPRWEDFLTMKAPGTFESYHVTFRASGRQHHLTSTELRT